MWETWDLVGYDKSWRHRVTEKLSDKFNKDVVEIRNILYITLMDGQDRVDPFVTMSKLVAEELQELSMGRPLWRETGRYFRHFQKDSNITTRRSIRTTTLGSSRSPGPT